MSKGNKILELLEKARKNEDEMIVAIGRSMDLLLKQARIPAPARESLAEIMNTLEHDTIGHQELLDKMIRSYKK